MTILAGRKNGMIRVQILGQRYDYKKHRCVTGLRMSRHIRYGHQYPYYGYWIAPVTRENLEALLEGGARLSPKLTRYLVRKRPKLKPIHVASLRGTLREYQAQAISYIDKRGGRALLADEMGLGKTIQAIGWVEYRQPGKTLVICPSSIKWNWAAEVKKWTGKDTIVLIGRKPYDFEVPGHGYVIINYDVVWQWKDVLQDKTFSTLIVDECHCIKNYKAQRTKATTVLCKGMKHTIFISGTPVINRPFEIYKTICLLHPKLFPNYYAFINRYCYSPNDVSGKNGASNTKELHEILTGTIMLRRLKKDVEKELPEKQRVVVPMEMDKKSKREYSKVESNLIAWIAETSGAEAALKAMGAEALVRIEKLKQKAVEGKMKAAIQWIENFIDQEEKLVVFCTHKATVSMLRDRFKQCAVILDGSTSAKLKQKAVEDFQTKESVRLFIGNLKSAGVGITLTAASNTCFLELGWTPGEHDQAEDRVHRIGQEADSVTAWYLVARNTVEVDICRLLDKKRKIVSEVLDGKTVEKSAMLTQLLQRYK